MPQMPLQDLLVVEAGTLLAGPFCGQLMGDFGARVIKVEAPGNGDPMRQWGQEKAHGQSLWWPVIARNKQSCTINLRDTRGQELMRQLLSHADIFIENFRPGTMERWGLGYDNLSEINPRLVMVRVSGFGQTGPYASRAGFGAVGEAMGGLRYICGNPDDPPSRVGISIGDSLAATFGCIGGLVALHERERSGRGQVVDSAIYEAVLNMMESLITEYDQAGYVRERHGPILPNVAPSNAYPTRDGKLFLIAANQDSVFRRLADAMGRPELAEDERYATHGARGAHQAELDELIGEWTQGLDYRELDELMAKHGIPAGGIYRAPEMLEDAHFRARQAIVSVPDPRLGALRMQNVAPRLSRTPGQVRNTGPELGEHNRLVFGDLLGLDDEELERLQSEGII